MTGERARTAGSRCRLSKCVAVYLCCQPKRLTFLFSCWRTHFTVTCVVRVRKYHLRVWPYFHKSTVKRQMNRFSPHARSTAKGHPQNTRKHPLPWRPPPKYKGTRGVQRYSLSFSTVLRSAWFVGYLGAAVAVVVLPLHGDLHTGRDLLRRGVQFKNGQICPLRSVELRNEEGGRHEKSEGEKPEGIRHERVSVLVRPWRHQYKLQANATDVVCGLVRCRTFDSPTARRRSATLTVAVCFSKKPQTEV